MERFILCLLIITPTLSFGQADKTVSVIDLVKIKNEKHAEAIFYYENNWKIYRDIAIRRGFIKGYKIFATTQDSTINFDLILITDYKDSLQFEAREDNFQKIIKEVRPNGPLLLNNLQANDFRENLLSRQAETLFSSDEKKTRKR